MEYITNKDEKILVHYKDIIENRTFDEYDIMGFLIFIRNDVVDCEYIKEFADAVAHRRRSKGIAKKSMKAFLDNGFTIENGKTKIEGYRGIEQDKWNAEWNKKLKELHIRCDGQIIEDITLCIYSLFQHLELENNGEIIGRLNLFIDMTSHSLCICTQGLNPSEPSTVCLAKYGNFNILTKEYVRKKAVETKRIGKKLVLSDEDEIILETRK